MSSSVAASRSSSGPPSICPARASRSPSPSALAVAVRLRTALADERAVTTAAPIPAPTEYRSRTPSSVASCSLTNICRESTQRLARATAAPSAPTTTNRCASDARVSRRPVTHIAATVTSRAGTTYAARWRSSLLPIPVAAPTTNVPVAPTAATAASRTSARQFFMDRTGTRRPIPSSGERGSRGPPRSSRGAVARARSPSPCRRPMRSPTRPRGALSG